MIPKPLIQLKIQLRFYQILSLILTFIAYFLTYLLLSKIHVFSYTLLSVVLIGFYYINLSLKNYCYSKLIQHFLVHIDDDSLPEVIKHFFVNHSFDFQNLKKQHFADLILSHSSFHNIHDPSEYEALFFSQKKFSELSENSLYFSFFSLIILWNIMHSETHHRLWFIIVFCLIVVTLFSIFHFPCFFADMKYTIDYISKMQKHLRYPMGSSLSHDETLANKVESST